MTDPDRKPFAELLTATMQVYGHTVGAQAIAIWWGALHGYTLAEVRAGLSAHVTDPHAGRFAPKPADVIGHLATNDGRPTPNEAWALCPLTEAQTTVWTEEARAAFFEAAYQLIEDGDRIGARMAFKGCYERLVAAARRGRAPIAWSVTPGTDPMGRERVIREAVEFGRLTFAHAQVLLPHLEQPKGEIAKLAREATKEPA